jgi:hypothetical protein
MLGHQAVRAAVPAAREAIIRGYLFINTITLSHSGACCIPKRGQKIYLSNKQERPASLAEIATMSAGPVPVPNSTDPFWRRDLDELDRHRTTANLPTESDIVIVGAGYAGAALAHFIYDDNASPPSVVVLEARGACSGATARNGMPLSTR